jgi:hypothetical protein
MKKPCLLIPIPWAPHNNIKNAGWQKNLRYAEKLEQENISGEIFNEKN